MLTLPPTPMPLRLLTSALLVGAALSLGACDSYDDEDASLQVFVADFSFDPDDYVVGGDDKTATFDAVDATEISGSLSDALETVGDGDMVMLYIDSELVSNVEGADGERSTWAALPLTRGFDQVVFGDTDGDGQSDGDIFVTGLLASYEYSFDNDDLYFDVVSSLPYTDFGTDDRAFFDQILPFRALGGSDDIDLRLVVIPDELFYANSTAAARVDLRDYEAVRAAYGLPD